MLRGSLELSQHTIEKGVKDELAVLLDQIVDVTKNATERTISLRASTKGIKDLPDKILNVSIVRDAQSALEAPRER